MVGNVLTGLFAKRTVALLDGTRIAGGLFFDETGYLLGYNIAGTLATLAYSFCGTYVILFVINKIPGLHFRLDLDAEHAGDITHMGETAYGLAAAPAYEPTTLSGSAGKAGEAGVHALLPVTSALTAHQQCEAVDQQLAVAVMAV